MGDRDIVAAIVAREQAGVVAAYDCYAPAVHAYCRLLLREPADAVGAVKDTFIVAAAKVGVLHNPDALRPWLYAVARNECMRRLRVHVSTLGDADEPAYDQPGYDESRPPTEAGRNELRELATDALAGLNPGDREVIELHLRHDFDDDDLADTLGISSNQASALIARARLRLELSLAAALLARTGQDSCWALAAILEDWDGRITVPLRKRINRHAERCAVCGEHRHDAPSAGMLLGMLPPVLLPPGLRDQVLHVLTDPTSAAARHRGRVVRRAGRFDRWGFPRPAGPARAAPRARDHVVAGTGMLVFLAVLGIGTIFALNYLNQHSKPPVSALTIGHRPASHSSPAAASRSPAPAPKPSATRNLLVSAPTMSPTPSASASPSGSPSPSASSSPSPSTSPSPSPSPSTTPPGIAVATPGLVVLAQASGGPYTGSFTITAQGGPIDFTISSNAPAGDLSISPASGSLTDGQQVTVTITVVSDAGLAADTQVTVDPGGAFVDVRYPPAAGG